MGKYRLILQHFPDRPCEISEVLSTDYGPAPLQQSDLEM